MRLRKFEVGNYKNFKDKFTLDLANIGGYDFNQICICDDLIKNAVIYGKNGVGKSNFGRAIMDITAHFVMLMLMMTEHVFATLWLMKRMRLYMNMRSLPRHSC